MPKEPDKRNLEPRWESTPAMPAVKPATPAPADQPKRETLAFESRAQPKNREEQLLVELQTANGELQAANRRVSELERQVAELQAMQSPEAEAKMKDMNTRVLRSVGMLVKYDLLTVRLEAALKKLDPQKLAAINTAVQGDQWTIDLGRIVLELIRTFEGDANAPALIRQLIANLKHA